MGEGRHGPDLATKARRSRAPFPGASRAGVSLVCSCRLRKLDPEEEDDPFNSYEVPSNFKISLIDRTEYLKYAYHFMKPRRCVNIEKMSGGEIQECLWLF